MAIEDIKQIIPDDIVMVDLLKVQMKIAQVKMKAYGKVFIDTEELIMKYERTDEDSRTRILEVISANVSETEC